MSRAKGKHAKQHEVLKDAKADLREHQRHATFGIYLELGHEVLLLIAACRWAATAKKDAEIMGSDDKPSGKFDPRGLAEYNRVAAVVGRLFADCATKPGGPAFLKAAAECMERVEHLNLSLDERPELALSEPEVPDRVYNLKDYDRELVLEQRIRGVRRCGMNASQTSIFRKQFTGFDSAMQLIRTISCYESGRTTTPATFLATSPAREYSISPEEDSPSIPSPSRP